MTNCWMELRQAVARGEVLFFEQIAWEIAALLPQATVTRTSEVIQMKQGCFSDEEGMIILLTPDAVEFRLPTLTWMGPHMPKETSKLLTRISLEGYPTLNWQQLIEEAQSAQKATFENCKYCGKRNPEGWMHDQDVCQGCAEQKLGIVY